MSPGVFFNRREAVFILSWPHHPATYILLHTHRFRSICSLSEKKKKISLSLGFFDLFWNSFYSQRGKQRCFNIGCIPVWGDPAFSACGSLLHTIFSIHAKDLLPLWQRASSPLSRVTLLFKPWFHRDMCVCMCVLAANSCFHISHRNLFTALAKLTNHPSIRPSNHPSIHSSNHPCHPAIIQVTSAELKAEMPTSSSTQPPPPALLGGHQCALKAKKSNLCSMCWVGSEDLLLVGCVKTSGFFSKLLVNFLILFKINVLSFVILFFFFGD